MRRLGWALVAGSLTLLAAGSAARAADYRSYTVANPFAPYSWAGAYIGANLGYEWGTVSNNPTKPNGVEGGVQAGYNWQFGQFVLGGEADIEASGANDTFAPWKFSNPWFGTLRARAGYAMNNILFYGTGGFAFGDLHAEALGLSESQTLGGWTVGAGMEVGFTPNWSAKVEYLYMQLGGSNFLLTGVNNALQSNVLRVGVNYRF